MGKASPFEITNFAYTLYLFQISSTLQQSRVSEESKTMTQFILTEIWKLHAVILGIQIGSANTIIWVSICGKIHIHVDEN